MVAARFNLKIDVEEIFILAICKKVDVPLRVVGVESYCAPLKSRAEIKG
jgi:hypothetical protein